MDRSEYQIATTYIIWLQKKRSTGPLKELDKSENMFQKCQPVSTSLELPGLQFKIPTKEEQAT